MKYIKIIRLQIVVSQNIYRQKSVLTKLSIPTSDNEAVLETVLISRIPIILHTHSMRFPLPSDPIRFSATTILATTGSVSVVNSGSSSAKQLLIRC